MIELEPKNQAEYVVQVASGLTVLSLGGLWYLLRTHLAKSPSISPLRLYQFACAIGSIAALLLLPMTVFEIPGIAVAGIIGLAGCLFAVASDAQEGRLHNPSTRLQESPLRTQATEVQGA